MNRLEGPARAGDALLHAYVHSYIQELQGTLEGLDRGALQQFADVLLEARLHDRQVFILGNGGAAATASHMACDLGKGTINRADPQFRRFRAISLADNLAVLTAISNDLSFDEVFVEQLRAHLNPGDVVVAISASGNSPNVLAALRFARERGAVTVGLFGFGGGRARDMVDVPIVVPSRNYGIAEDFQVIVQHVVTQYLRRALAGPPRRVLFLDRDGIINERPAPHQYVTRWEEFHFVAGAVLALQAFVQLGFSLVVVTNQQGVGKGLVQPGHLADIHQRMAGELEAAGVAIDGIYTCPHLQADNCFCRKPQPGLIYRALNEADHLVDLAGSFMVGDSASDIRAGHAAGLRTVWVGDVPADGDVEPSFSVRHLSDLLPLLAAEIAPA